MKTVKAKIELSEDEIRVVLAEYLGVKPSDVHFNVVKMQRDGEYVTAIVTKEIRVPASSVTDCVESAYEHYCPDNK